MELGYLPQSVVYRPCLQASCFAGAYHRVNRCGGDRHPAGGVNVSRVARHLGADVRGKI